MGLFGAVCRQGPLHSSTADERIATQRCIIGVTVAGSNGTMLYYLTFIIFTFLKKGVVLLVIIFRGRLTLWQLAGGAMGTAKRDGLCDVLGFDGGAPARWAMVRATLTGIC